MSQEKEINRLSASKLTGWRHETNEAFFFLKKNLLFPFKVIHWWNPILHYEAYHNKSFAQLNSFEAHFFYFLATRIFFVKLSSYAERCCLCSAVGAGKVHHFSHFCIADGWIIIITFVEATPLVCVSTSARKCWWCSLRITRTHLRTQPFFCLEQRHQRNRYIHVENFSFEFLLLQLFLSHWRVHHWLLGSVTRSFSLFFSPYFSSGAQEQVAE